MLNLDFVEQPMSKSSLFRILFFILIFRSITIDAQLDLEHWFSPIFLQNSHVINSVTLNLSTPSATPVEIKIFDGNNNVIKSDFISSSSPLVYKLPLSVYLASKYEGMRPIKKGFHVSGSHSFYASVRLNFDNNLNTEWITSKGKTAIGNLFYSVNAPYQDFPRNKAVNFQSNIIATRDNTKIKISGYSPKITFADGKRYPNGIDITLNKGESYCLVSTKADNSDNDPVLDFLYWDSFIGSKIQSDKPIAITNGNFLGNYFFEKGGKILIDQSVPVKETGKEYYIRKGFVSLDWEIEGGLIVSTKDNTKVYLNGSATPNYTLNEGEFKILKSIDFKDDGIFIKSDNAVYFYQFAGGNNNNDKLILFPYLTPTMAFVPPLDPALPNTIGSINNVEKIDAFSLDNLVHVLAYKPRNISVNNQTYNNLSDIPGSADWKYFTFKNLNGNLNITSDNSLIVGIIGGSETKKQEGSFSGYYTGFSNDPFIQVNGNCIQEVVTLKLSNIDFETFQWQLNGTDIPGANGSSFLPTKEGNYNCIVTYSGFSYKTDIVNVKNCSYKITEVSLGNFCGEIIYAPKFSLPNESIPVDNIEIITSANNSNASISNGNLIIVPNRNYNGTDRLILRLSSKGGVTEIQKIDFTIFNLPLADVKLSIDPVKTSNDFFTYNLENVIISYNNETFIFYKNQNDINANTPIPSSEITEYETIENEVYVLINNNFGCTVTKKIILNKPKILDEEAYRIPNVFTPNDDGINDYFDFSKLSEFSNLQLKIFDRFGKEVYNYVNGKPYKWDGKNHFGMDCPSDNYWIIYQFDDPISNTIIKKNQWLLIKRD